MSERAPVQERSNLLVIICDQMRADVLGCYGSPICRTPHLDALAAAGTRFARAYTTTPLCTPARGSLMTGRYPHSHRLVANTQYAETPTPTLPPDERMVSEHLAAAGYRCDYAGKWHLNRGDEAAEAMRRGFTTFGGTREAYAQALATAGIARERSSLLGSERIMRGEDAPMCGTSPTDADRTYNSFIADEAIALLRGYGADGIGDAGRPFALWCSMPGPHFPLEVPAPYDRMYDPASVPRPASFADTFAGKPGGQCWHPWLQLAAHLSWPGWQRLIAHYWGYVTYMDALVGRVLAALDEAGLRERTAVVFLADHGEMAGHHRMFDKGPYLYEDVMRVPLIFRYPGKVPDGVVIGDGFANLVDLAPTLCGLAGIQPEGGRPFEGQSLLPALRGDVSLSGDVFAETNTGDLVNPQLDTRMIRRGDWKYVFRPGDRDELYHLGDDPNEMTNRIADARVVRADLRDALSAWMERTQDPLRAYLDSYRRYPQLEVF